MKKIGHPGKAGSTKQAEKLKEQVLKAELTDSIASVAAPVKELGSAKKHTAVAGYDPGKGQLFLYVGKKRGGRLVAYENHAKKGLRHVYTPSGGVDKKIHRETQISLTANGDAYFISNHHAGVPRDLFKVTEKGFADGSVFDFSTLRMKTQLYKEISIGYAREWNDKLNVGINVKPLFGMVAGMTDINRLELRTSREKYEVLVDGIIRVSAPVSI